MIVAGLRGRLVNACTSLLRLASDSATLPKSLRRDNVSLAARSGCSFNGSLGRFVHVVALFVLKGVSYSRAREKWVAARRDYGIYAVKDCSYSSSSWSTFQNGRGLLFHLLEVGGGL
jgi:hypothetical protein